MENCIFCKIADGKIPSAKVYEDDKTIAFLDISPASKGHCLVIPRKHSESLDKMQSEDAAAVINAAQKVAKAVHGALKADGYNVLMNNGKEAGQVVFHAHLHVVPRFKGDGIMIKWEHKKYENNEVNEYAEKIRKFI